jgi:Uncharacterized conserved protein
MNKYRHLDMIILLGGWLVLTLTGCGGHSGGGIPGSDSSYSSTAVVTTFSGSGSKGNSDGDTPEKPASFNAPTGITLNSGATFLYVADYGSNLIRQIRVSDQEVTTFRNSTSLSRPEGLAFNGLTLYVCNTGKSNILSIDSSQSVSAYLGSSLKSPAEIVYYNSNFYVADSGYHVICQISTGSPPSITTTYGERNTPGYNGSSPDHPTIPVSEAQFNTPYGVASDGSGKIYVTDTGNNTIRVIDVLAGNVTLLAGKHGTIGSSDSTGSDGFTATFNQPKGIAYYRGYLFVTDTGNHIIRMVNANTGVTVTIAGYKGKAGFADGTTGNAAKFFSPIGIVSDDHGILYVADQGNNRIRKIVVTTLVP